MDPEGTGETEAEDESMLDMEEHEVDAPTLPEPDMKHLEEIAGILVSVTESKQVSRRRFRASAYIATCALAMLLSFPGSAALSIRLLLTLWADALGPWKTRRSPLSPSTNASQFRIKSSSAVSSLSSWRSSQCGKPRLPAMPWGVGVGRQHDCGPRHGSLTMVSARQ